MSAKFQIKSKVKRYPVNDHAYYIMEEVSDADLELDEGYQRTLRPHHVDELVEGWDWGKFRPLDVSCRNGNYYVFDGGHRLSALKRLCGSGQHFTVLCRVFYGLTRAEEAYYFSHQDDGVMPMPFEEKMRADVVSGDKQTAEMISISEKVGFKLSARSKANGTIQAIKKATQVWNQFGPEIYEQTLQLIMDTWGGDRDSVRANMLGGVAVFLVAFGSEIDPSRFVKKLKVKKLSDLQLEAKWYKAADQSMDGSFARSIAKAYNYGGGKWRLPEWRFAALGVKSKG